MRSLFRKIIILIVGLPIVLLGIILVPLPGPGLLIMFAGFFVLSLEFDWAKKYVDQIRSKLGEIISKARARADGVSSDTVERKK